MRCKQMFVFALFVLFATIVLSQNKKPQQSYYDSLVNKTYNKILDEMDSVEINETEIIDKIFL